MGHAADPCRSHLRNQVPARDAIRSCDRAQTQDTPLPVSSSFSLCDTSMIAGAADEPEDLQISRICIRSCATYRRSACGSYGSPLRCGLAVWPASPPLSGLLQPTPVRFADTGHRCRAASVSSQTPDGSASDSCVDHGPLCKRPTLPAAACRPVTNLDRP